MTPAPADKNHLQIRCPSCSQKFKVGSELMGRMVECGSCESRFEVGEDVLVKGSHKFYPGERNAEAIGHFQRVPGPTIGVPAYVPAAPGPQNEKGYYSPITRVSRFRIAVGWVGVVLIGGFCAYLLKYPGGALAHLPAAVLMVVALAVGITGVALLVFANPRTRARAFAMGTAFAAISLSLPFVFRSKQSSADGERPHQVLEKIESLEQKEPEPDSIAGLKAKIGTEPLEIEIRRMSEDGNKFHAYGVWLRDLSESNKLAVRDYILRATGANPSLGIYARDNRDYLMVLTGISLSIDELAAITSKFSKKQKMHSELAVIESQVDGAVFIEGPLDKLTDKSSPAFYDLNKRELESIQLDRVSRAVKRITDAEPKIYRDDITRQLVSLVGIEQVDFTGDICLALSVWAENPSAAGDAVLMRMNQLARAKKKIPREMVAFLAKAKAAGALPIVQDLWLSDPTTWEQAFGDFGPLAEKGLLVKLPELRGTTRHSAVRVLMRTGTAASLPALESIRHGAEPELAVLIDDAEKAIRNR